jgi:hypothetical protein
VVLTCLARDALSGEQDAVLVDRPVELESDVICKSPVSQTTSRDKKLRGSSYLYAAQSLPPKAPKC